MMGKEKREEEGKERLKEKEKIEKKEKGEILEAFARSQFQVS